MTNDKMGADTPNFKTLLSNKVEALGDHPGDIWVALARLDEDLEEIGGGVGALVDSSERIERSLERIADALERLADQ
jgi:hypothetical protein